MQHNLQTVYRKMRMNANIVPAEMVMVLKDFDKRLVELEGNKSNGTKEPVVNRRKSNKVPKEEVSTD